MGKEMIEGFGHQEQRYQDARVCWGRGQCPLEANQRPSSRPMWSQSCHLTCM